MRIDAGSVIAWTSRSGRRWTLALGIGLWQFPTDHRVQGLYPIRGFANLPGTGCPTTPRGTPMPAIVIIAIVALALAIVAMILLAIFAPRLFDDRAAPPADPVSTMTILDRIAAEGSLRYDSWQLEPSHRRPTTPYTIEQAHVAMQQHRMCRADVCGAKSAAMCVLEDARKIQFDERADR